MADSQRVMGVSARPHGFNHDQARSLLQLYSYARNSLTDWRQWVHSQRFPDIQDSPNVGRTFESYRRRCARSNRVDFDDLQVLALQLLADHPDVRLQYQDRFRVILVDEYQDTNLIQARLLKHLASPDNVITVVGDDAQAIYGFRAATVENILQFERDFSADRVVVRSNYRSTPEIVALANESIRNNQRQIAKDIRAVKPAAHKPLFCLGTSAVEEARFVAGAIQRRLDEGASPETMAVLFRATRQAAALEVELKRAHIPYVLVGGEDFFGLSHIKLVMDLGRLLRNPDDSVSLGALQELIGFSSPAALENLEAQAELKQLSIWDVIAAAPVPPAGRSDEQRSLLAFRERVAELNRLAGAGGSVTAVISGILDYLTPYLKRRYPHNWGDVESDYGVLQSIAAQFTSLGDFLNVVALEQFVDTESGDGKLVLSTIHSAKGLEWEAVFVIGLVEFWFPLNWALQQTGTDEEERRLFYVAVTRARQSLCLTSYAQAVNPYGSVKPQQVSRFVRELPASLYDSRLE